MKTVVSILILILIIFSNLYSQGIPYGQEFQVNTYTNYGQSHPSVGALLDGGFVACWDSFEQDGSLGGVYCQLFDSSITKIGPEIQVNTTIVNNQNEPCLAILKNGGFVICWESSNDSNLDIFGQIFDATGNKKGVEFLVNSYTENRQQDVAVTGLQDGSFVVCWQSLDQDGSKYGIFGQIFESSGVKRGTEFQINTYTTDNQTTPSIAGLQDGGFVVCWEGLNQETQRACVFAQMFDEFGKKRKDEFMVNTDITYPQIKPSVIGLLNGGFVVCWSKKRPDDDIFGQLFDSTANRIGDEFQVNSYTQFDQMLPSIARLKDGGFVVSWTSTFQDGSSKGVYCQLFVVSGVKNRYEFRVNDYTDSYQGNPTVAQLIDRRLIICWQSEEQDGSKSGIFGKIYLDEPIVRPLNDFLLLKPINEDTMNATGLFLIWQQPSNIIECFPWEITFDLYIDNNSNFTNPKVINAIQDTTYRLIGLLRGKTYFWKVLAKNLAGDSLWSTQQDWGFFIKPGATSVATAEQNLPTDFELCQNYPNPFNSSTGIKYSLAENSHVSLKIYDVNGRLVDEIILTNQEQGEHEFRWTPQSLRSGVYLIKIQIRNWQKTIKAILLK